MQSGDYTKLCEGCNLTSQKDTKGWEIGYGHNAADVTPGLTWTQAQADITFYQDDWPEAQANAQLDLGPTYWEKLDFVRQEALSDMAYEMGQAGLDDFHQMLAAIRVQDWQTAHDQCLASAYASQVPSRAKRAALMLLTGQFQPGYGG